MNATTNAGRMMRSRQISSLFRCAEHSPRAATSRALYAASSRAAFSTSQQASAVASPSYKATPASSPSTIPPKPAYTAKPVSRQAAIDDQSPLSDLTSGLADEPIVLDEGERQIDWSKSFHGLSAAPFSKEAADILLAPIDMDDVEVKPDGIIYLPEIKYRRILNRAFGPGGWGLAPRGETIVTSKSITREYALLAHGR